MYKQDGVFSSRGHDLCGWHPVIQLLTNSSILHFQKNAEPVSSDVAPPSPSPGAMTADDSGDDQSLFSDADDNGTQDNTTSEIRRQCRRIVGLLEEHRDVTSTFSSRKRKLQDWRRRPVTVLHCGNFTLKWRQPVTVECSHCVLLCGSFRLKRRQSRTCVYLHGASAGNCSIYTTLTPSFKMPALTL